MSLAKKIALRVLGVQEKRKVVPPRSNPNRMPQAKWEDGSPVYKGTTTMTPKQAIPKGRITGVHKPATPPKKAPAPKYKPSNGVGVGM